MYQWPSFDEFMRICSNDPTTRGSCCCRPFKNEPITEVEVITLDDSDSEKSDVKVAKSQKATKIDSPKNETISNQEKDKLVMKDLKVKIEFQNFCDPPHAGKKEVLKNPNLPTDGAPRHVKCRICKLSVAAYGFRNGKRIFKLYQLKRHASCHFGTKLWCCCVCEKTFFIRDEAKRHIGKCHKIEDPPKTALPIEEFNEKLEKLLTECFGIDFGATGVPVSDLVFKNPNSEEKSQMTEHRKIDGAQKKSQRKRLRFKSDKKLGDFSKNPCLTLSGTDGVESEVEIFKNPAGKPQKLMPQLDGDNTKRKCKICGHFATHAAWKNGKLHSAPSLLRRHAAVHLVGKFHQCPFCGKRSNRRANIVGHLKTHHKTVDVPTESFVTISEKEYNDKVEFWMQKCFDVDFHGKSV